MVTTSKRRGSGERQPGGIYVEYDLTETGSPVESYLVDPPVPLNDTLRKSMGITVGVTLTEMNGVWHIIDWIESERYPNVLDFIEEVRRLGISRRLPISLDFSKLTVDSRIILVHNRAYVDNFKRFNMVDGPFVQCPQLQKHEHPFNEMCVGYYWEDVEGGELVEGTSPELIIHSIGDVHYMAHARRVDQIAPVYIPGIFGNFPIQDLTVIQAPDGSYDDAREKAGLSSLPVHVEVE